MVQAERTEPAETLVYPGSETVITSLENPPGSRPMVRPNPIMKADDLCFLLWELPDFEPQHRFLIDFGMLDVERTSESLIMRGYGKSPYLYVGRRGPKHRFVGLGFLARSRDDLKALAEATGCAIEPIDRPGGGEMVRLEDPLGQEVEVCFGIEEADPVATREEPLVVNTPNRKQRINQGQRAPLEPAPVVGLGHCVTSANNMEEVAAWYMLHLGLIPTDVLCLDDGSPMIAFMRLDRGDKPADHHCFVAGEGGGESAEATASAEEAVAAEMVHVTCTDAASTTTVTADSETPAALATFVLTVARSIASKSETQS